MSNGEVRVTLGEIEQQVARMVAERRTSVSRSVGVEDKKTTEQAGDLIELEGVAGELAFCRWINAYPDLSGDSFADWDVTTHKGRKVDVKTTRGNQYGLIVSQRKASHPADVYVLMVGSFPSYRCAGYATKEEVFRKEHLSDPGGRGRPAYVVPESKLHRVTYRG